MDSLVNTIKDGSEESSLEILSTSSSEFGAAQLNQSVEWPPLHTAAYAGLGAVVEKLLELGADPKLLDIQGNTAADWAVEGAKYELCSRLIEKGSSLNEKNETLLPLLLSIHNDNENAIIDELTATPVKITAELLNLPVEWPPLHNAAYKGLDRAVNKLVECGAVPEGLDINGETAASWAVAGGRYKLAASLKRKGSYLKEEYNIIEPVFPLLEYIDDEDEERAISYISENLSKLTSNTLNIHVEWPPLHLAAYRGLVKVVEKLLESGADPSFYDSCGYMKKGYKALHNAVIENHPEVVELLVSKEDVNDYIPFTDDTLLCYAIKYDYSEVMAILINAGADITKCNEKTKIPTSVVKEVLDSCMKFDNKSKERKKKMEQKKKDERKLEFNFQLLLDHTYKHCNSEDKDKMGKGKQYIALQLKDLDTKVPKDLDSVTGYLSESQCINRFMLASSSPSDLLTHPMIKTFLLTKWRKIEWIYILWILIKSIFFVLLLNISVDFGVNPTTNMACLNHSKNHSEDTIKEEKLLNDYTITWSLSFLFLVIFATMELLQIGAGLKGGMRDILSYMTRFKNIIQWAIICGLVILLFDSTSCEIFSHRHIVGLLLPMACYELLSDFGFLPGCHHIIEIFKIVMGTFLTYLAFYAWMIIAFAASFFIMLPESSDFPNSLGKLIVKFIVMFTGEQEFMDIPFSTSHRGLEMVFFTIFLISITVVLMNVLNALAVRDIQELMKEAEVPMLKRLFRHVLYWEDFLHFLGKQNYFRCLRNRDKLIFFPYKNESTNSVVYYARKWSTNTIKKLFLYTYVNIEEDCILGPSGALQILSQKIMEEEENLEKIQMKQMVRTTLGKSVVSPLTLNSHVASLKEQKQILDEQLTLLIKRITREFLETDKNQLEKLIKNTQRIENKIKQILRE